MTVLAVHGALLVTQLCWGSAAVVNKLGLSGAGISPLLFALIRELSATPILLCLLVCGRRQAKKKRKADGDDHLHVTTSKKSWKRLVLRILPGFFIFMDQLCSLTGVSLADGLTAAAWQPSQVVFTLMISVILGMESLTVWKVGSMLLTVAGALCLVFFGGSSDDPDAPVKDTFIIGQLFFFFNCLASSLEVIVWRKLLTSTQGEESSEIAVMAESYLIAAVFMVFANVAASFFPSIISFVCPKCNGEAWHVPTSALYAIFYSVIFQTIIAYIAQAWALKRAPASLASLYATAQPIMAALVTMTMILVGFNPSGLLHWPGKENLGAVFIIAGLVVAEYGTRRTKAKDSPKACCADANSEDSDDSQDSELDSSSLE